MDGIRTVATSICFTLICTGVFSILVPGKGMERVLKFAIGLFFLSSLVLPFTQNHLDFSFSMSRSDREPETQNLEQSFQRNFIELAKRNLELEIDRILNENQIESEKTEITVNINADNSIDITKIVIQIPEDIRSETGKITGLIEKEVGILPEIVVRNQSGNLSGD